MSNKSVIKPNEFNFNKLSTTPLRKKGDRLEALMLHNNKVIYLKTPYMSAPFGVSSYEKGNTGTFDWSINMAALPKDKDNEKERQEMDKFISNFKGLDNFMIENVGIKHYKQVFGEIYDRIPNWYCKSTIFKVC